MTRSASRSREMVPSSMMRPFLIERPEAIVRAGAATRKHEPKRDAPSFSPDMARHGLESPLLYENR